MVERRSSSGAGFGFTVLLLAIFFIVGPIFASSSGVSIPSSSLVLLVGFGVVLLLLGMIITTVTRLYHRAPADRAFVRTGMGGAQAILDGGALVIPVVHEVVWVSLRTMRIEITRAGKGAVITKDFLRADITAEFFIKVPKEPAAVKAAATSLGIAAINPQLVQEVLDRKLDSALRQVAAEMELTDLLVNRAAFIAAVSGHVQSDIANNGFTLESVTISALDQTPTAALQVSDNIFDAQGLRKITEITAAQSVARNELQLTADREIRAAKVATSLFLYEQDVAQARAEADRDREIQIAKATAAQLATTQAAEQQRLSRVAEVERDRAVQLAQTGQQRAVEVANQERDQAIQTAVITRETAVAVATREQQISIAAKETERARAEAEQLAASAERQRREQEVTTVTVTAGAEREKQKTVIDAQAAAEKQRLGEQVRADIAAYTTVKNAQAAEEAAQRQANATIIGAKAAQEAQVLRAEGEKAVSMVPVQVAREQVEVSRAQTGVDRAQLEQKAQFETISRQLQVELARIAADRDVQIAAAEAMGVAFSAAKITVWGDPAALAQMTAAFRMGQQVGQMANGFAAGAPEGTTELLSGLTQAVLNVVKDKFGLDLQPEQAAEFATAVVEATRRKN